MNHPLSINSLMPRIELTFYLGYNIKKMANGTFEIRKAENNFLLYETSIYQTEKDVRKLIEKASETDQYFKNKQTL